MTSVAAGLPAALALLALLAFSTEGHAHPQSETYLAIVQNGGGAALDVRMDVALRELEHVMRLDTDADGQVGAHELEARQQDIVAWASAGLRITTTDTPPHACALRFSQLDTALHLQVSYVALRFHANCPQRPREIDVRYSLLFDIDAQHRALAEVRSGNTAQALVFDLQSRTRRITLDAAPSGAQFSTFVRQGIAHIWEGYDHVLFLLTLLLPAVLQYRERRWEPRGSLRDSLLDVLKVVTAFTLAHSLTLALGTLGWVSLPTRLVESAIALTVLLGALNLLVPVVQQGRWRVAFVFGLIHGLAFASVLVDLGLQGRNLLVALLGFNSGVEIGQLAIVLLVMPLIQAWCGSNLYRRVLMPAAAVAIAAVSTYWFVSRAFG